MSELTKYSATFTVTKSFEIEIFFEAPNAEIAAEMAADMEQDDCDFVSDRCDAESNGDSIDSVTLDGNPVEAKYQTVRVDRSVQRWCEQWLKDRAEDEAA